MLASVVLVAACGADVPGLPTVEPNDNRVAAGDFVGDTVRLRLVVDLARWYPETEDGPHADVAAFAVEGEAPSIPAPLIRVRTGTVLDVTVRNALTDSTLNVHGLGTRPQPVSDSVAIAPGDYHRFVFAAGAPGTYMYFARPGVLDNAVYEREQLVGAFIVDPASGPTDDRVMVLNIWSDPGHAPGEQLDVPRYRNALAVNGRSYPFGETIDATVGEEIHWRVINATARQHPMHLHGFYFAVESEGDPYANEVYTPAEQRHIVTDDMRPFTTMNIRWTPDRDGNWLFHCHLVFHVSGETARLRPLEGEDEPAHLHMSGLVVPISVSYPPGKSAPVRGEGRRLRLFVQEAEARGQTERSMGYVLQRDEREPAADSVEIPGTPLVLTRDEPTDVVVINRLSEPTGLHWHGLELESFSDGVAGYSGSGARLAPLIAPGDSFVAQLSLPRAGTFMYHTHFDDIVQLTSGLYGPLIVMEPGETFDPATDHVVTASWDGEDAPPPLLPLMVDGAFGSSSLEPMVVEAGVPQRFRFINIGAAQRFFFSVLRDGQPVALSLIAKDGADLPEAQRRDTSAPISANVGETVDVTVTLVAGEYELVVDNPINAPDGIRRPILAR
jgi:FtsP/CotA-like multicopper oxidase with cupredoxin domain